MFILAVPYNKKGVDGYYCSLVQSTRTGSKVVHKTVARLGFMTRDRLPYLKAAFSEGDPDKTLSEEKAAMEKKNRMDTNNAK